MLNISIALFLLIRGRQKKTPKTKNKQPSLKGKLLFTEYFLSLKLLEVPWGSKLNILKFPPQFVYNHKKKCSSIWYWFRFQAHLYQKMLFLQGHWKAGEGEVLTLLIQQ